MLEILDDILLRALGEVEFVDVVCVSLVRGKLANLQRLAIILCDSGDLVRGRSARDC